MLALPIAERELRVAARAATTFWTRVSAAALAFLIGAGFLIFSVFTPSGAFGPGKALYSTLGWLSFLSVYASGLFLTADCLSQEKRAGTLGFLFLTDLRAYDVIAGKFLASSLKAFYALLAIFPVLSLTILMGGVTPALFVKGTCSLANALFCSVAAGLLVSSLSTESQRAMTGTFLLLVTLAAAGPLLDRGMTHAFGSGTSLITFTSPVAVFSGSLSGSTEFWSGLLLSHLVGWLLLVGAACILPRRWQNGSAASTLRSGKVYDWKFGTASARASLRKRLLEKSPLHWLVLRERFHSASVWALVLIAVGSLGAFVAFGGLDGFTLYQSFAQLFVYVLYLAAAVQSSRFFFEARRSGLLELLSISPLSGADVLRGYWQALLRGWALPVSLILGIQFACLLGSYNFHGQRDPVVSVQLLAATASALLVVPANLAALVWFGVRMGLVSRSPGMAALKTLVFVQFLPSLGISFVSGIAVVSIGLRMLQANTSWLPLILIFSSSALSVLKDLAFILVTRRKLHSNFREFAGGSVAAPVFSAPPRIVPAPVLPTPESPSA